MFLLFLLIYKRTYIIHTWGEKAMLDCFGFLGGSHFEFNFSEVKAEKVFVSLCNQEEYKRLSKIKQICKLPPDEYPEISSLLPIKDDSANFSGRIDKDSVLYPVFSACNHKHAKYKLTFLFKQNANFLMDSRMIPSLIFKPIFVIIYLILGIIWIINWIQNRKVTNSLHLHCSCSILFSSLHLLFQTIELYHYAKTDTKGRICFLQSIFDMFATFWILTMILMISHGVCSIHLKISAMEVFQCMAISFIVSVPSSLLDLFNTMYIPESSVVTRDAPRTAFRIECYSIFVALRFYFVLKYIQLFNESVDHFFRENLVIELKEIKKKTREFKRFKKHFFHILLKLILYFMDLSLTDFSLIYFWISQLVRDILVLITLCESAWIGRLQSVTLVIEAENLENRSGIRWEQMRLEDMRK